MAQFGPVAERFRSMGVPVVFIAAQKRGGMFAPEKFLRARPAPFPFLLDESRAVTKAFGVYVRVNLDSINIARPATFVIDGAGRVRWIYLGARQEDRAPIDEVIAAVEAAR